MMLVIAASTGKKRLNVSTPHSSGIAERTAASSSKTRTRSSQRGRSRRGRIAKQPQTPVTLRPIDYEQLVSSGTRSPVIAASCNLAEVSSPVSILKSPQCSLRFTGQLSCHCHKSLQSFEFKLTVI